MTESKRIIRKPRHSLRAGMRWFGPSLNPDGTPKPDHVPIKVIAQTPGVTDVVSALHHVPAGDVWTREEIAKRKIESEFYPAANAPTTADPMELYQWYCDNGDRTGLLWETVESLPFTDIIKTAFDPELRDQHINNFKQSLQNLAGFGIKTVVGNFMVLNDWTRNLIIKHEDGSWGLAYQHAAQLAYDAFFVGRHAILDPINPKKITDYNLSAYIQDGTCTAEEMAEAQQYWNELLGANPQFLDSVDTLTGKGLPGAQEHFSSTEKFRETVKKYQSLTKDQLWDNIDYFLLDKGVTELSKELGITLCCHPDDPSFSLFGLPRVISGVDGYKRLLDLGCGVNICTGSLMTNPDNRDPVQMIYDIAEHGLAIGMTIEEIFPHIHLRPIITNGKDFYEGHHAECGEELSLIVAALVDLECKAVWRPDHALAPDHHIGGRTRHGYDAVGRGYGAEFLQGLFTDAGRAREQTINLLVKTTIQSYHHGQPLSDEELTGIRKWAEAEYRADLKASYQRNLPQVVLSIVPRGTPGDQDTGPVSGYSSAIVSAADGQVLRLPPRQDAKHRIGPGALGLRIEDRPYVPPDGSQRGLDCYS